MKLSIEQIHFHRNGIGGAPFHALLFDDPDVGPMFGIVFDEPQHVAVFQFGELADGNIAFGRNSWRGDRYEPHLREAIASRREEQP